jgi:hypothetical protein
MWKMYTEAKNCENLSDIKGGSVASKLITDYSVATNTVCATVDTNITAMVTPLLI